MFQRARKWTSSELKGRIHRRHPLEKGWFTTSEFCPTSGSGGSERMDAVAVCLYRGRGFATHGFEVKVRRSDWLDELNNPAKNSAGLAEVDFWWIVAPSTDVVRLKELEPKWGLYTCSGRGLRATRRAERLKKEDSPFSRPFVVSLLWKVANLKMPGEEMLEAAFRKGRDEKRAEVQEFERKLAGCDTRAYVRYKKACDAFQEKAGIAVQHYDGGAIGAIVRAVGTQVGRSRMRGEIVDVKQRLEAAAGQLKAALKELKIMGKG